MQETFQDPRILNQVPKFDTLSQFLVRYIAELQSVLGLLPEADLDAAFKLLKRSIEGNARIYVAGNGGSSSIADHLCCDWMKGIYSEGKPNVKVHSLTSNSALFTALSNDCGYEFGISRQVEMLCEKGDVVILISSSGNSPNILNAAKVAQKKGIAVIGFTGFSGGALKGIADVSLHLPLHNYGMVEDGHQMIMHVIGQFTARLRDFSEQELSGTS
jgi:D-sedoheptulose 7-phosphate isomerase